LLLEIDKDIVVLESRSPRKSRLPLRELSTMLSSTLFQSEEVTGDLKLVMSILSQSNVRESVVPVESDSYQPQEELVVLPLR
jgi:hypothetical protein